MTTNIFEIGEITSRYKGIPVYENGIMFFNSQGKHYASDGYYYGQKWQCVEFVKRFYKLVFQHEMPFAWGHARDYFDSTVEQSGGFNSKRGLMQFNNGGSVSPAVDDIIIFRDSQYGHVGIVVSVSAASIEIIQQNIYGKPRQHFKLEKKDNCYSVSEPRSACAWLRMLV